MEYYSAIRKDGVLPLATIRTNLENVMLSELTHTGKNKNHMISLIVEYKTENNK